MAFANKFAPTGICGVPRTCGTELVRDAGGAVCLTDRVVAFANKFAPTGICGVPRTCGTELVREAGGAVCLTDRIVAIRE